jgi:hypothetical protein
MRQTCMAHQTRTYHDSSSCTTMSTSTNFHLGPRNFNPDDWVLLPLCKTEVFFAVTTRDAFRFFLFRLLNYFIRSIEPHTKKATHIKQQQERQIPRQRRVVEKSKGARARTGSKASTPLPPPGRAGQAEQKPRPSHSIVTATPRKQTRCCASQK